MFCTSINYKNADVEIRKQFAFSVETQHEFIMELMQFHNIYQCIMLCTCNRTEVYFCGSNEASENVNDLLAKYGKIEKDMLLPYIMFFQNDSAIFHLFKVACGIESMVIGEDEILRQTKDAYKIAEECGTVSSELNMIFQSAISCSKKIKTQTLISKSSVSIATLTAKEVAKMGENVNVLLIGATGRIGSSLLKNLISYKNIKITITLRHHNSDFKIISDNVQIINYSDRYRYIGHFDCIISATSSPHYTVTLHGLQGNFQNNKKRLFVDLAVPPDIDRSISHLDFTKVIDIDYFKQLAKENNAIKLGSVDIAKTIIECEIETLKKELQFHDFMPYFESVKSSITEKSFEEFLYKLKSDTTAEQFSAVLSTLKSFGKQE